MGQLQYIGARYVPIWYQNSVDQTANWEVNVEYEPLTWVTTQNNHLYLSKKTVPDNIGTPAQNTDYWLDMGVITGNVQDIQDQIDAIVQNIGSLSDLATTDKSSIVNAINEIVNGGGGGGGYSDPNKKVFVISDSYGTTYPDTGSGYKTFFEYMQDYGMNVTGFGYSGDGFIRNAGTGTFQQNFDRDTASMTQDEKDEVTTILVAAGRNDWPYGIGAILTAIGSFVSYCNTNFPNARVVIAFIGNGDNTATFGTRAEQFEVYKAFSRCSEVGAAYLNGSENILKISQAMSTDKMHPSEYGRMMLGRYLVNGLKTGYCEVRDNAQDVNFTFASGVGGSLGCEGLHEYMENGVIHIRPKGSSTVGLFTFTGGVNVDAGVHDTTLGTISGGMVKNPVEAIEIPLGLTPLRTGGTSYVTGYYHSSIVIDPDGNVIWKHYSETALTGVTLCLVGDFNLAIPAVYC